jgi:Flp pilus assembly protein TadG
VKAHRRPAGQALAEFALVLPVFLLIVLGLFDVGRLVMAYNGVANAARQGARLAVVDQNAVAIEARARETLISFAPTDVDVTAETTCEPVKLRCPFTVDVSYRWRAITPVIGNVLGPVTVSAETVMPVERVYRSP